MKNFFLIFCLFFFSYFHIASAIEITEVMYDTEGSDTDREWIEIYNNEDNPVDVSTYKFFEADTNHTLTLVQGDKNLPTGGYAVIVQNKDKFKIDWPNFTGPIFDSSFSLSNDGETIGIKDSFLNIVDQYNYTSSAGAQGDGKSLQKINDSLWTAEFPTVGLENTKNKDNLENILTDNKTEKNIENMATHSGVNSEINNRKTITKIIVEQPAFVEKPLEFKAETINSIGEKIFYGKYFWNFGDGSFLEIDANNFTKITHVFPYEGEYLVSLEYFSNFNSFNAEASAEMVLKITRPKIIISKIGPHDDFFIEIENQTKDDINLENWILRNDKENFIFPKNTKILSNKKIILSPQITKFIYGNLDSLKLFNSSGNLVDTYLDPPMPALMNSKKNINSISLNKNNEPKSVIFSNSSLNSVENKNLTANLSAIDFNKSVNAEEKKNFSIYIILLIFVIVSGAILVYFLRKKSRKNISGEDFEILE